MHGEPRPIHKKTKLLDRMAAALRVRHLSLRTEKAYLGWARRYILFHDKRHPRDMGDAEIARFLSYLAVERKVSASTQNQALNAILFLYREVLGQTVGELENLVHAKRPARLPVVLTPEEVKATLNHMKSLDKLLATTLYGSGMRIMECPRLRIKDLDFTRHEILIREAKGDRDRRTMLPRQVEDELRAHMREVKELHRCDLEKGFGRVQLPYALDRKYPNAAADWAWQYVFPSRKLSRDPRSGILRRHHLDPSRLQKAFKKATRRANLTKPATCHTLRHYPARRIIPCRPRQACCCLEDA